MERVCLIQCNEVAQSISIWIPEAKASLARAVRVDNFIVWNPKFMFTIISFLGLKYFVVIREVCEGLGYYHKAHKLRGKNPVLVPIIGQN